MAWHERDPASFTAALWGGIEDVWAEIRAHPFLAGLKDGSLDHDAFVFYVVQDAHYLREYARALAVCGARANDVAAIRMFCEHAAGAIAVERELHESFFADFGLSEAAVAATPMAPTNVAYTSYLLASAYGGSYAEAVGAVLPCYWIYAEVGRELLAAGSPDPRYQRWIDTYGGDEFAEVVAQVLDAADALGPTLSDADRAAAAARFRMTSRYEWLFWQMGLEREAWPVGAADQALP